MNARAFSTKILIICSVLLSVAFNGDDDPIYFYLNTDRIYSPDDTDISVELSGRSLENRTIEFRAFRIDNPVDFFIAQKDPHSPSLSALEKPNTFDMLRMGYQKIKRDARYAAQDIMPSDARRAIRDVIDLNGVKADKDEPTDPPTDDTASYLKPKKEKADIPKGAEDYEVVANWEHKIQPSDNYWHYESIPVPLHKKGVYLIEGRAGNLRSTTVLVISELGMIVKSTDRDVIAFVVNRKTGEVISDFPLQFAKGGALFGESETGDDGIATIKLPEPKKQTAETDDDEDSWEWRRWQNQLLIVGENDGNFIISDPYNNQYGSDDSYKVYLHTDRPVYRPSQQVYYRGVVRHISEKGTYEQSASDTVYVQVNDARSTIIQRDTLLLSDMGTFSGELTLGEEPPLGYYSIQTTVDGQGNWFNFSVEEYKKPEYKVTVATDRELYNRGDSLHATVTADYFFGSPVANGQVEYFVFRSEYYRPWWRGSEWAFLYEDDNDFYTYRMEMVHSGNGTLNSDGTFAIDYLTDGTAERDYVYKVQANVVDNSRRSISGAKSVEVTRGEFYISTRTDKYVYKPNDEAAINVEIATFENDTPVATTYTVRVVKHWWDRITVDSVDGNYQYKQHTDTVWNGSGRTGTDGKGQTLYTPKTAGYFNIVVTATDKRGTAITESSYIYVSDDSYANWYREGASDVQIIPDKVSYVPGETMNALVVMPAAGIDVLVTAEGTGIYSKQVERLSSTSAMVHIPIKDEYAPMFYLNVSALFNDQMYSESQRVIVIPQGKLIELKVETSKEQYKPGEQGTVTVYAYNENGKPVSNADIALGIVDEAVYSIRPDATENIQRAFYGVRWNSVSTSSSLYFSFYGETRKYKGEGFVDGPAGGDLSFESNSRDKMVARAGNPAENSDASRLSYGDIKGEMFVQPAMRKDFKDLMFWTPSVRTDGSGKAVLNVTFPDNLTTWRINAYGVTGNTAVGQTTTRVVARKDLLVRMETPRFLTQGDELLIATTVHNYLKTDKLVKVEFSGENIALVEKNRTIRIPANGEERVDWKINTQNIGNATLSVKALTNEESDAMTLTIPVLPRGLKSATGDITDITEAKGSRTLTLTLPDYADPQTGELYVSYSPSLASAVLGSLDELIGYPYGCVEQTMSRFLPTLVVADALEKLNVPFDQKKRDELPKMIARGLGKLYGMQHSDGGWGWWEHDETNPYMTAYVMYGMTVAKKAGYAVEEDRYANGSTALRQLLQQSEQKDRKSTAFVDATTEAYILYVLSMQDAGATDRVLADHVASLSKRDSINNYSRALLALAAQKQGNLQLAQKLVGQLERNVTQTPTSASWQGKHWHYNWQDDQVETSAFVVKAILAQKGETELVKKSVRWLLGQKQGDAWDNTRQTATVIYSLVDYLKTSLELNPNYTVMVKVNGKQAFTQGVTTADVFAPEKRIKLDKVNLAAGTNTITIEKVGKGNLYASTRLVYYATGPAIKPASAGFTVSREYYTLTKERKGDVYVYNKRPYTGTVKTGDELLVKVKVTPDSRYQYVMLEDPLPAGCEVINDTEGYNIPGEKGYDESERRRYWGWNWWYADKSVRDEKVSFFATDMGTGNYEFSYLMRAQIPGSYAVMPAVGSLMYYPEIRGNSSMIAMTIKP